MGDYVVDVWHEWPFTPGEEASVFVSVAWLLFLFFWDDSTVVPALYCQRTAWRAGFIRAAVCSKNRR
jgi:hypothetical protein